jgi:hypothetical protein
MRKPNGDELSESRSEDCQTVKPRRNYWRSVILPPSYRYEMRCSTKGILMFGLCCSGRSLGFLTLAPSNL